MLDIVQKKEKGTKFAPTNSVKNQFQFTQKESIFKKNSLFLINKLLTDLERNNTYIINENQIRLYSSYISQLQQIKKIVSKDPRYPHQIAQTIIDNTYGGINYDKNIKGAKVHLIFKEIKNNPNYIPYVEPIF